jgi:nuclear pore complex protein Nup188
VDAPGGGPPLAAAVASYVAYPYAAACCALAFPALAAICAAAPNEPPLACALPSLAPSSLSASAFALTMHGEPRKKDAGAEMDPRAAIVRALTPDAARYAPGEALAAAAFITAAASSQPMLAESMLLPAKLSPTGEGEDGCDVESALDSLWTVLGNAKELREEDPRL